MARFLALLPLLAACSAPDPVVTRAAVDNGMRLHVAAIVGVSAAILTLDLGYADGTEDRVNVLAFGGSYGWQADLTLSFPSGPMTVPPGLHERDLAGWYSGPWWGGALVFGIRKEDVTNGAGVKIRTSGPAIGVAAASAEELLFVIRLGSADDS